MMSAPTEEELLQSAEDLIIDKNSNLTINRSSRKKRGRPKSKKQVKSTVQDHSVLKNLIFECGVHEKKIRSTYYWNCITLTHVTNEELSEILTIGSVVISWSYSCPLIILGFCSTSMAGAKNFQVIVQSTTNQNFFLPNDFSHPNPNRLKKNFEKNKKFIKIRLDSIVFISNKKHQSTFEDQNNIFESVIKYFEEKNSKEEKKKEEPMIDLDEEINNTSVSLF